MVLRTNLATRPFYNVRVVQAALGAFALVVLGFTIFNVVELTRLSSSQAALGSHAEDAEREAQRLRTEAARIRTQISAAHSREDLEFAVGAFAEVKGELGV